MFLQSFLQLHVNYHLESSFKPKHFTTNNFTTISLFIQHFLTESQYTNAKRNHQTSTAITDYRER